MNLKSVAEFSKDSPFSESQLRWFIFNAQANGMAASGAIVRMGRRVYIDTYGFGRWIAALNPAWGQKND
jgi:hypothetical protein